MASIIPTTATLGFHVERGTVIITTAPTMGETHEGEEVTCPAGAIGVVDSIVILSAGLSVTVSIHAGQSPRTGEDVHIVNVFEASDHDPRFPFVRADSVIRDLLETVREIAKRDPVFAKGHQKQEIADARALIARAEGREG